MEPSSNDLTSFLSIKFLDGKHIIWHIVEQQLQMKN